MMSTSATWKRKILYDASTSAESVCDALGLVPCSPDVAQREEAESEIRTQRVGPFLAVIDFIANSLSEVYTTMQLPEDIPPEIRQQAYANFHQMLSVSIGTAVSLLIDEEFLIPREGYKV